jgi:uncharacterized Ntn-hydrolase superfamily protein
MTYSIVARDPEDGTLAIAVASRFFAVGSVVPYVRQDVAVATQAFVNPMWGIEGVARLQAGASAPDVIADLVALDAGEAQRQCHLVDGHGEIAAHTGEACVDWAGHVKAPGVSVAGNMLAGPDVVVASLEAYLAAGDLPMPDRMLAALRAGEAAGGDRRGRQAAALRVNRWQDYAALDLRVDDHADPLDELDRLLDVARERFVYFADCMGTQENFAGTTDRTELERTLAELEQAREAEGRASRSKASGPGIR